MALRRENYTHVGIGILVYVLSILSISAQNPACPIWADQEPNAIQKTSTPTIYSQSVSVPFYDWNLMDNSRLSDDQYVTVALPGINRSEITTFSRWGHKIPDGSTIHGIKLSIEGHQTGSGKIRDVSVQLQGSSENKAGQYLGIAFPDSVDQVWRYGGANDTWGRDWTSSEINSEDFGLIYQVRNSISSEATLHIDQISIEVFYTPLYTVCNDEHACVAFGVEEIDGYNYNWDIPIGFERLSSLNEQYAVNIGVTTASFGPYDLCLDVYDESGNIVENCCRTFLYKDCRPTIIGDLVFLDQNQDNVFSLGDVGVAGVTVYLYDEFDILMSTTITDQEGFYQFETEEGNYYVQIELPDGTLPIEANIGNDNFDSDLTNFNGPLTTDIFYAAAGVIVDNIDVGLAIELIVGDQVWEDKNYNGIQDSLEIGVADISVYLLAIDGDTLQITVTDVNGFYGFRGIRVDEYEIRFSLQDKYWSTIRDMSSDDVDSDIDENGSTGIVNFSLLDMPYLDLDAGLYRFASVGDFVFFDSNENGIQDVGDLPQDSILISLSTSAGIFIKSILTDASGMYLFDSLTPGEYIIEAEGSELIEPTFSEEGSDASIDSDLLDLSGNYQTDVFTLMSNESNVNIDLGWINNLADIKGFVFEDVKYDGQYNSSDVAVPNILVELKDENGVTIQSQLSNDIGTYHFMDVLPGMYYITFDVASNYLFTQPNVGDTSSDSDVTQNVDLNSTDIFIISLGQKLFDIDAGLYRPVSIGDYVFLDLNEDGIQNEGDSGLEGIVLTLFNEAGEKIVKDTTNANGLYSFDDLVPGVYYIELIPSDLYLPTLLGQGNTALDSDLVDDNGRYFSKNISTCSGENIASIDFGFINNYGQISGQVYEDSKADGVLNIVDTMIVNVPVTLYNQAGEEVLSTITNSEGNFLFENILAGEYYIQYGLSEPYIYSTNNITNENGFGSTDVFILSPGEVITDQITGAYILGIIGDYVFLDLDEDGIQGLMDTGLSGIQLSLINDNGEEVMATQSEHDGSYRFEGIVPGVYTIGVTSSDLYLPTLINIGGNDIDSDLLGLQGDYFSSQIVICSGQNDNTIDFGFVNDYATVGGQLYEDSKADSLFNNLDTVLVSIRVILYNDANEVVQITTTDANGNYLLEDILAGDYYIVYGLGSEYIYTTEYVSGANGIGSTNVFTLAPGEENLDQSTGAYRLSSIGDYVFLDLNENGIQDEGDEGLAEIMIELYDFNGNAISVNLSEPDGSYFMGNLIPGEYSIEVNIPDLYLPTAENIGNDELDSDLLIANGVMGTDTIIICSGQNEQTIDLGFINNYAQISGSLFEDLKANGIFDSPDTLMMGITVDLYSTNNTVVQSTVTGSEGNYSFNNILTGNYFVVFNLPTDYIFSTLDVTGINGVGSTNDFSLRPGEILINDATGAYRNASVGNMVFFDSDDNGILGLSDYGIQNVELSLINELAENQGVVISDENGEYLFENITPGLYTIRAKFEDLYIPTLYQEGTDNEVDSDLQNFNGSYSSDTINICSGQDIEDIDFGLMFNYAKVGGLVFTDLMSDGQYIMTDELLEGIPVALFDESGVLVANTETNAVGSYLFENVIPDNYYLEFDLGAKLITPSNIGPDDTDSDVTGTNGFGTTDIIELIPGECNLNVFAGAYELVSIGDFVWSDYDRNGYQNIGEPGIENVIVNLYDNNSVFVSRDTTNQEGNYGFYNLQPGMYYLEFEYPQDLTATLNVAMDFNINSDITDANGIGTTDVIILTSGTFRLDIDVGFVLDGSEIGGEVWIDLDGDTTQSSVDALLSGIPVMLYNADNGAQVSMTVTNQIGKYSFKPIPDGNYYIRFEIEDTLLFVTPNIGPEARDSDVDGTFGVGTTDIINVTIGDEILDIDAGVEDGRSHLSGQVFIDKNGNGIDDISDIKLKSYTVNLHDENDVIVKSVLSDDNGNYEIIDIPSGNYYLSFIVAEGYYYTNADIGTDDTLDSDVINSNNGSTDIFTLGIQDTQVYDAGVYLLGNIGDFAWFDSNGNGIQDIDEQGLEAVDLTIINMSGEVVSIAETDANGNYLFADLAPGRYWITIQAPLGFEATFYQTGMDTGIDSDLLTEGDFIMSDTIMIMSGQNNLSIDFGFIENSGSIEGFAWNDINLDGVFNDATSTFEAIQVELYTSNNTLLASTTTDLDGGYVFSDVIPDDYYIKFVLNNNTSFTDANQENNDNLDSDVNGTNGDATTDVFTLNAGQEITNIFAGLIFPAKIGDLVFLDENGNGLQDLDEPGIAGFKVILYNEMGMKLDSVETDNQGMYTFSDLDPANYYLEFVYPNTIQPTQSIPSMPILNSDITDANGSGSTDSIFLGSGVCNEDIDGGFVPAGAIIAGEAWLDIDQNNVQDDPNNPIEGIAVGLFKIGAQTSYATTVTNEVGLYSFNTVPTGSYFIEFEIPDSLGIVDPYVGAPETDSDITNMISFGSTDPFIVIDGQLYDNIDAGLKDIRSNILGQLFLDGNADGIKDVNNVGLSGIDVTLFDSNEIEVQTTKTDSDGNYSFVDLHSGDYFVQFSNYPDTYLFTDENIGSDDSVDSDIDESNGIGTSAILSLPYDDLIIVDGGIYELGSIGDFVWIDENENGIQDVDEEPLAGVLIEVLNASSQIIGIAISDDQGFYIIDNLVPGTYSLSFTGIENYIPTLPNEGSDDSIDSDIIAQGNQAVTGTFDIASGENNTDFDAGYIFSPPPDAVISGIVWRDSNGNGIREMEEPLLNNINVVLFNETGIEQASVHTLEGEYIFSDLLEGNYYVVIASPLSSIPTLANEGSDDSVDSDITGNFTQNSTDVIMLDESQIAENIDGGFISVGSIGDQVFVDVNGNGRKGNTEPGLNGVTVKLFSVADNTLLQTTITELDMNTMTDGIYRFDDVLSGSYYLEFELPSPYLFTTPNAGSNENVDSDVLDVEDAFGTTEIFTITSEQNRDDIDAGVFLPAQLGDFVWNDLNADGIQDVDEPGIANVDIALKRSNGIIIGTTSTDEFGGYCFDSLKQGLYLLEFEVPQGFVVSPLNEGNDNQEDSDADETGVTPLFSLANGVSLKNVDVGFYEQNENNLRSHLWFDENSDGLFEFGESKIKDVEVRLLNDQGELIAQQYTNHVGKYAFIDIPKGEYQVSVGINDGFATTDMNAASDDMIDSDVDEEGMSAMFTVDNGLSVPNIDIGFVEDDGIVPEMVNVDNDLFTNKEENDDSIIKVEVPLNFVSGPNPFYNRIQIRMNDLTSGVTYDILRMDGAVVKSGLIIEKDQWIELEGLTDGMYILVVSHKGLPVDKQYLMKVN